MKKYKWIIIFFNLIALLAYFNYSIAQKEQILKDGTLVLLKLAPVDPRSLMQGDYMALRYDIGTDFNRDSTALRGYCIVKLDQNSVGQRQRFQPDLQPLQTNEYAIAYRSIDSWNFKIGAESFFFQEGEGGKFQMAEYGGLKLDKNGNSILVGLYDKNYKKIE